MNQQSKKHHLNWGVISGVIILLIIYLSIFLGLQSKHGATHYVSENEVENSNESSEESIEQITTDTFEVEEESVFDKELENLPEEVYLINWFDDTILLKDYPEMSISHHSKDDWTIQRLNINGVENAAIALHHGFKIWQVAEVFTQVNAHLYKPIFAQHGYVAIRDNKIVIGTNSKFYLFHSCPACNIENDIPGDYFPSYSYEIKGGELYFHQADKEVIDTIINDLKFIKEYGIPELEGTDNDFGVRRSFCSRIVAYHHNTDLNVTKTKKIFNQYYTASDSLEVWERVEEHLKSTGQDRKFHYELRPIDIHPEKG